MIDSKALAKELKQARSARIAAEDAWCEVEELLWEVQRGPHHWRRIALADEEDVSAPLPH